MSKINSIGIAKEPKDTLVVVAMSGGVDSSTVAAMMKTEGYNVIGITLKLYNDTKEISKSKQCCAGQDIMDAKRVADKLKIEHKILYYQDRFKEGVIDNFIDSYLNGETPIPCV
jgi:tRNA-specific 2-thiouridylase